MHTEFPFFGYIVPWFREPNYEEFLKLSDKLIQKKKNDLLSPADLETWKNQH